MTHRSHLLLAQQAIQLLMLMLGKVHWERMTPCQDIFAADNVLQKRPSERFHEREMQYELDISTTAYNIEEKIKHLIHLQSQERQKFYRDYSQRFLTLIVKWNLDTKQMIKQREKLMSLLQVQENLVGQSLVAQKEKMKEFKELCEQYLKGLENIEDCRRSVVADEIKNQMAILEGRAMPESVPEARAGV